MQSKSKQKRVITGAHVAKAKANHFVMDRIKAQHLLLLNTKPLKAKPFTFADASKVQTNPSAMEHTANYKKTQLL
jgi:hypothetical protein